MKFRHTLLFTFAALALAACNQTLAADVTPPPNYIAPTPAPTLGPLYPEQAPDIENGKNIYAEKCVDCHGAEGLGNGSQAKDLPVSVIPIGLPEFANEATQADWYAVVTQGRIERFMPPFASLTDQERWDVVSYALMLQTTPEQLELGKTLFEEKCQGCEAAFTNLQMMSALSKAEIIQLIRTGEGGFPAFGSDLNDEEAFAVAAYIRSLSFAAPAAPVAEAPTEASATAETNGTPQAETTPASTEEPQTALSLIKGQIDNQGDHPLPTEITLRGFDHGADPSAGPTEFLNAQGILNEDGSYTFEVEPIVENQIYLTEVTVGQMTYQSEFAVVPANVTELELEPIVVYSVTEDLSLLKVEELQIFFDLASEETQVFAVYFITNNSGQTVKVPMAEGQDIPFIAFPEGSTGLGFETTDNTNPFVPTEDGFAMPPAETPYGLIAFASLPKEKETQITQSALLPINAISIFLPEGVEANGATLTDTGIQDLQGTNFHVYTAAPVEKDGTLTFTLSGEPKTASETADLTQNQYVLIGVGALGITLILAGVYMYLRDRKRAEEADDEDENEDADEEPYEDAETIMDAIIALDDLHRAGKIKDEAYHKRREELTDALKKG